MPDSSFDISDWLDFQFINPSIKSSNDIKQAAKNLHRWTIVRTRIGAQCRAHLFDRIFIHESNHPTCINQRLGHTLLHLVIQPRMQAHFVPHIQHWNGISERLGA